MPFTHSYDRELRILRIVFSGPAVPAEYEAVITFITTSAEFPPDVDAVWDLSGADFGETRAADLRRLVDIRQAHALRGRSLVAVVVPSDVGFGMSRMFQAYSESAMPEFLTVTRSLAEGERWILDARARRDR